MRAAIYTGAGGPEVIRIGEVPAPEVKPGYIRVRVHAGRAQPGRHSSAAGKYAGTEGLAGGHPRPRVRRGGRGGARDVALEAG